MNQERKKARVPENLLERFQRHHLEPVRPWLLPDQVENAVKGPFPPEQNPYRIVPPPGQDRLLVSVGGNPPVHPEPGARTVRDHHHQTVRPLRPQSKSSFPFGQKIRSVDQGKIVPERKIKNRFFSDQGGFYGPIPQSPIGALPARERSRETPSAPIGTRKK